MLLTIIKKNKLDVFTLPSNVFGNYWITYFENGKKINVLNVEARDGKWYLISNSDVYAADQNGNRIPSVELSLNSFILIKDSFTYDAYYLYVSPIYDKTYKEFAIDNIQRINVGGSTACNICYKLNGLPECAFTIEKLQDNRYYLSTVNNTPVYVNQKIVVTNKRLEYGDVIFLHGLKIILMKKNNSNYLLVNNPNNLLENNIQYTEIVPIEDDYEDKNEELIDDSLHRDIDYFYRAPHFYKVLEKYVLAIDSPPSKKGENDTPVALTLGPMITMAMTSMITLISTVSSVSKGDRTLESSATSLIMSFSMLASAFVWPLITKQYQKYSDKKYEKKRQKLYGEYINKKEKDIQQELANQKNILTENNFSVSECQEIIRSKNIRLWQRRITDEDFLTVPVGIGTVPMEIEVRFPEEHFSLSEDNLLNLAYELGRKERVLTDVPITYSFKKNVATGVIGDPVTNKEFIDRVILQMMANYSYDELKIVTFTSVINEKDWDYMKVLPHSWSNDKAIRYFGSSSDDDREMIYVLEKIYNERVHSGSDNNNFTPHYVIVTDAIKSIDSYDFIKNIMSSEENYGFSIIMLVNKISALPNECKNFIQVARNECSMFNSVISEGIKKFVIDYSPIDDIYSCAKVLSNIPIDIKSDVEAKLPDIYHFLEMYQVGKVEQLNCLDRWKMSNPILSLQAPVGIGRSGELITLDLHEKYHGPHGLIAGTTGSGKSEFIITFILSLAITYHPYEVQIILIDYKGGSLTSAFANDRYTLPHLAGTITNLDGSELNRSLASIESEVKRRQREFNDAKRIANESTMDIYKYQKLYREGRLKDKEPIAHLFIISDEFAELKEQQPEFMDNLISVARVGRSLGIHLILATQKPGGVVNQQIWSNTRFRVCLKVQDTSDSQEVIKKPDAAYLQKQGRFYLQVGTDEVFTLGQSAWSGGQYYPSTTFRKEVDTSVNAINNIGFVTTSKESDVTVVAESLGEELPNTVKYICDMANMAKIKIRKLWLDKIPEKIYVDNLKEKYNFTKEDYVLCPVIGEYDNPEDQGQYALTVPFTEHGNAVIYGITGSGKEDFLLSLIYSCMSSYTPEEVNFYVADFGSETLRVFNNSPYVGDMVFLNDSDKFDNLFKLINTELEKRKQLFASYGGTYTDYIKRSNEKMANWIVILNNYEAFAENYDNLSEELIRMSREAYKYGIFFCITASAENSVRSKARQNFSLVYVLNQNNDADYSAILGNVRGKIPGKNKGRGLFKKGNIYEFQTAFIKDENQNDYILDYCQKANEQYKVKAKRIPVLPSVVDFDYINDFVVNPKDLIVGVSKSTLEPISFNLDKNSVNVVSSQEIENMYDFTTAIINQLLYRKYYKVNLINTSDLDFKVKCGVYTNRYDEIIDSIDNYLNRVNDAYQKDNNYINKIQKQLFVIYGVKDFINKLSNNSKNKLANIMKLDNLLKNIVFIFIDTPDNIKAYLYEDWLRTSSDLSKGIWIGRGVVEQNLFKIGRFSRDDNEEIKNDFGYVIVNGRLIKSKLLSEFNVK